MPYEIHDYKGGIQDGEYLPMRFYGGFFQTHAPMLPACRVIGTFYNSRIDLTITVNGIPFLYENVTTDPFWLGIEEWGSEIGYEIFVQLGEGDRAGEVPEIEEIRFGSDPSSLMER